MTRESRLTPRHLLEQAGAKFVTLDDTDLLAAIENDPAGQLSALMADIGDNPLIIDEAQRSKKMALAINQKNRR